MKTYEELKGMTQEDLVRLALENQEEIEMWKNKYEETDMVCNNMKELLKNLFTN